MVEEKGMRSKQGEGYPGTQSSRRRTEVASLRDPDKEARVGRNVPSDGALSFNPLTCSFPSIHPKCYILP